jgi:hypothetical protein
VIRPCLDKNLSLPARLLHDLHSALMESGDDCAIALKSVCGARQSGRRCSSRAVSAGGLRMPLFWCQNHSHTFAREDKVH